LSNSATTDGVMPATIAARSAAQVSTIADSRFVPRDRISFCGRGGFVGFSAAARLLQRVCQVVGAHHDLEQPAFERIDFGLHRGHLLLHA
jgi:hypothetical protein